jgi:hypothetical protein
MAALDPLQPFIADGGMTGADPEQPVANLARCVKERIQTAIRRYTTIAVLLAPVGGLYEQSSTC